MTIASTPRRAVSFGHSQTGSGSAKVLIAWAVSWSVLMPGKTTTPMRAVWPPDALMRKPRREANGREAGGPGSRLVDGERVVLDDGVGEQLATHLVDLAARLIGGCAVGQVDLQLDELAHAHSAHAVEPEGRQRALDSHTLGVEDAVLGGHIYA